MYLKNEELSLIYGGSLFSATLLNAFARVINTLYSLGHALGSSVRRIYSRDVCK